MIGLLQLLLVDVPTFKPVLVHLGAAAFSSEAQVGPGKLTLHKIRNPSPSCSEVLSKFDFRLSTTRR